MTYNFSTTGFHVLAHHILLRLMNLFSGVSYLNGLFYFSMIVIRRSCYQSGFIKDYLILSRITVFSDSRHCELIILDRLYVLFESCRISHLVSPM